MTSFLRSALLLTFALFFSACGSFDSLMPRSHNGRGARGATRVKIDLSEQRAYLYKRGDVMAVSRISTGKDGFETPPGRFRVVQKDRDHRSTVYGDYVSESGRLMVANVDTRKTPRPPGAVFRGASMPYFLRFNGAIGMHAGNVPWYPASHGCVRLPSSNARLFFQNIPVGATVLVNP